MTLLYTDSPLQAIGRIDITDPPRRRRSATSLDGEPTLSPSGDATAIVGVNTSESFTEPSGRLVALDVATRARPLLRPRRPARFRGAAPEGSFVSVAIENERDEDANDGALPSSRPACW